jgi:Fe-Mn family superoxide dismutase
MAIELPPLPYPRDALAPHISANTLDFHYGKHHQAYVTNFNKLAENGPYASLSLVDAISKSWEEKNAGIFNNAAQVWNHTFYWSSMKKGGGGAPRGEIARAIDRDFGSYDAFRKAFAEAGATQFGSGWAWLSVKNGKLEVSKTPNAETPLTSAATTPLLTMDVWEHAYYLDYQNRRPDYIATFLDHLVSWDFVNENLAKA